jgi:hypothetical protein
MKRNDIVSIGKLKEGDRFCFQGIDFKKEIVSEVIHFRQGGQRITYDRAGKMGVCLDPEKKVVFMRSTSENKEA